jgi:hypothetical protein
MSNTTTKIKIVSAFAPVNPASGHGPTVNAPLVAEVVAYVVAKDKVTASREDLRRRIKVAIATSGTTPAAAAKQLRAALVAGGIDRRRVSEVLLDLGVRERAASTRARAANDAADLADAIAALVAHATELAGDKAVSALRRAYLSAKGRAEA